MSPHLRDYRAWHDAYDDPNSSLSQRMRIVKGRLAKLIFAAPAGPIRVISMCAGQGRDVVGVLPGHTRQPDVSAFLFEVDSGNVRWAREAAAQAGLSGVEVLEGDAAVSDVYAPFVPADVVLACGIFGNVSDAALDGADPLHLADSTRFGGVLGGSP